jgi:malonyl-CoA O-methyltransferase
MDAAPISFSLDRRALARSFDRAGAGYDAAAQLQRRVRGELLERLRYFALEPQSILDLGAGTCQGSLALRRRFPRARVIALDIAPGMLKASPRPRWPWRRWPWARRPWPRFERVCGDACALPLASRSVELIYSNLMLQWCDRPEAVFRELSRVLKPGGLLVFSSFGPDTLQELRLAWQSADHDVHVSEFPDMPQLGEAMMSAGFIEPVMDVERHRLLYPDTFALMRELQRIGARNASNARSRALTGRARLQRMVEAYELRRTASGLPATFEVIFGAAFGAAPPASGRADSSVPGEFAVPLTALGRARR